MARLVPAIHAVVRATKSGFGVAPLLLGVLKSRITPRRVDGRDKPGHDDHGSPHGERREALQRRRLVEVFRRATVMEGREGFTPFAMTEWRMEHILMGAGRKSLSNRSALSVTAGLAPAIHAVARATKRDCSGAALKTTVVDVLKPHMTLRRVDGRDKPGHDGGGSRYGERSEAIQRGGLVEVFRRARIMAGRDGFAPFAITKWRIEHILMRAGQKSLSNRSALSVMAGLVPAIHAVERATKRDCSGAALKTTMVDVLIPHMTPRRADGQDKPGHDGGRLG